MEEEVFSFARSKGAQRYLLEHPQKLFKELGLETEDKLAVLVNPSSAYDEELKFFEKVSRLSSLQCRYFNDFETAANWLKSNQPDKQKQ